VGLLRMALIVELGGERRGESCARKHVRCGGCD